MEAHFSKSDKELLSQNLSPEVVIKYFETKQQALQAIYEERETNPTLVARVRRIGLKFIKIATALDPIISIVVPSSPEYAIPYGCLKLAFQFIVDNTTDKKEDIVEHLEGLSNILDTISFENDMGPTGRMKKIMATIYVHVLDFLERVIEYTNLTSWGKMQKAIQSKSRKDYKFADRLIEINKLTTELASLADKSRRAMEAEVSQLTILSAAAIQRLYTFSRDSNSATSSSITLLKRDLEELHKSTQLWARGQATSAVYALLDILLPGADYSVQDELMLWSGVAFKLSQADSWERNGILEEFIRWGDSPTVPFLAIGPYGSKDSWVTPFSLSLITLLRSQKAPLTFALCDRPPSSESWSPTRLVKQLLGQLLEQNPMLVLSSPQIFNAKVFTKARGIGEMWAIFRRVVAMLDSLVIVIDRIDRCEGQEVVDEDAKTPGLGGGGATTGNLQNILKLLADLMKDCEARVKVIITSAACPPQTLFDEVELCAVVIDTQTKLRVKIWDEDDEDNYDSDSGSSTSSPSVLEYLNREVQ
ncbi:hypothetical protein BKA65DRAFT_118747 [Rhexocercosporidium sp. MPI-PUGE-AT-0058]|nr:hypothetical protein BKA65DRAFT_118747 [Rhexocercosporidium sp. MPI-PUGE-AT-0058]